MIASVISAEGFRILRQLQANPRREVYACMGGGYAINYGGGEVTASELQEALDAGLLESKYPDKDLEVWVLKGRRP
jgi:hypothetical protein